MKYWAIVIPGAILIIHCVYWLFTKGVIWVAFELFNVNWYDKFWVVYVGIFLVGCIFGKGYSKK